MTFEEKINGMIKDAMKAREKDRLEALRSIKAGILNEKTKEGAVDVIPDEVFVNMLQKMVKQRDDSAKIYTEQNRPELAEKEIIEAEVIREFLPKPLPVEEVEVIIKQVIAEMSAQGMKDMGKVMGKVTPLLSGKADSKAVAELVKKLLTQ
ncbi:MAG: GatB/YqeY domain-containing protein [Salinivirgaceae bacterium]|nr:GatB/YqeY domain-containing protein [Salinivirgaceae bacterium]MDD4746642.1 GatB/YqeY domain-containing protein [Salinivirgaceae bacterium]MDY0279771.1 GatB/YqeY domain-containing protein [Salinivirgaceae bacterium]